MNDSTGRLFGGLALLAIVWIGVYWWWTPTGPSRAPISFAEPPAEPGGAVLAGSAGADGPAAPPSRPPSDSSPEPPRVDALRGPAPDPAAEPPRPAVIPPQFREYTIRPGDTFESIARRELGSAGYATAIGQANPFVDPTRLKVGQVIRIPLDPSNIQGRPVDGAPPPVPPSTSTIEYTVRHGDSLSTIAKAYFGKESAWEVIYAANRDRLRSPDDLKVGQRLRIPRPEGSR